MASLNATSYLSAVKWQDEDCYLHDFVQKNALPQVTKIVKGQYLTLGVPSLSCPSLNQIVFIAHAGKRLKVAAQCVKFKDGSRVVPVGNKLAIPDNYNGWFEILSEDGRAVRCINGVAELIKRFPETCLVRENIKAYVAKPDDMAMISDKSKTLFAGETLVLVSEVQLTPVRAKSPGRYLRCFTKKGETVYLSVDQKGKFSPVAGQNNISGVHTIKNLLSKRFPLMVRLVHGKSPTGLKSNSHFLMEMRLYSLFEEESIVALPLLKDSHILSLPFSASLKVQAPKNSDFLVKLKYHELLVEKCKRLIQETSDKIQVFDISLSKELRSETEALQSKRHSKNLPKIHRIQRSASDPNGKHKEIVKYHSSGLKPPEVSQQHVTHETYDEIDKIYDYVRGFAPLPPKIIRDIKGDINGNFDHAFSQITSPSTPPVTNNTTVSAEIKPEPPPIETIPARKKSRDETQELVCKASSKAVDTSRLELVEGHIYEKIGRKNTTKSNPEMSVSTRQLAIDKQSNLLNGSQNYTNHGVKKMLMKTVTPPKVQQKTRFFKHSKSSPALKVGIPKQSPKHKTTRSKSLTTSPLFNIRYKSLINLAIDFDTLDSSNSGGQTSLGSGGSREKRQRPKSLTDLFGESNRAEHGIVELTNGIENRKLIFSHETVNGKLLNGSHNKRIGTLYL